MNFFPRTCSARAAAPVSASRHRPTPVRHLLLATVLLGAAALPFAAAAAPVISVSTRFCLDVKDWDTASGAPIQVWPCHGGYNQQWEFTTTGEMRTLNGTRCLDATGHGTTSGTAVSSSTCNGQINQKWRFNGNGTITGVHSGLCLDVVDAGTSQGTGVQLWGCHARAHQRWGATPDRRPPTPPGALKTANLACRSVNLSWAAATDNVGVARYDIYHDGQHMTSVSGSSLSAALTLTPGATWGLYVNARDPAGNVSQASPTLSLKVPSCDSDTQPPSVPTNLRATVAGTAVTLNWTASTDNVAVTSYDIFRNDTWVGNTPSINFTDVGLAVNTVYRYTVQARDAQRNVSAPSVGVTITTAGACSNPVCSVSRVASETDLPWGLVTLPSGNILYGRRDVFNILLLNPVTGVKSSIGTVPNVTGTDGEGGLLGLAVTANFPATDPWLYIYHTTDVDNRIIRMKVVNGQLVPSSLQVLLSGIGRNKYHNGGRLRFGPDGKLYATTGDAQNAWFAQDVHNLAGKVLRLNQDGSVPADNPFGNHVWSYGHRNPQGLAFDSAGRLWEQEFGNSAQDETNLIVKGGNYGWPNCEGTLSIGGEGCATPGFIAPKQTYRPVDGSCSGIAIVRDVLYVACQRGTRMYRFVISGSSLTNVQQLFVGTYGRLRTVEPTRDGNLWLTTSNTGDKDSIPDNSVENIFRIMLGQ